MLAKRIISCLDIKEGKTVKGVRFKNLADVGDPVEMAARYNSEGADELVFLDISATLEGRKTFVQLVERMAACLTVPFTVGGGIASVHDAGVLLQAGADKVAVNSAAVMRPALVGELSRQFGSQCIVAAVDARSVEGVWRVTTHAGTVPTQKELFSWARELQDLGAGEILFTSMDHDGTQQGYACDACRRLSRELSLPVIASGGAGSIQDFVEVLAGPYSADAALAAGVFHYGQIGIGALKQALKDNKIPVR